jgi:hypothetical protein
MQDVSVPLSEYFVTVPTSMVLKCRCGEKLWLLGHETDWRKEGRTVFLCGGCGEPLSLDDITRRVSGGMGAWQPNTIYAPSSR